MKVKREPSDFRPITITLETEAEVVTLLAITAKTYGNPGKDAPESVSAQLFDALDSLTDYKLNASALDDLSLPNNYKALLNNG